MVWPILASTGISTNSKNISITCTHVMYAHRSSNYHINFMVWLALVMYLQFTDNNRWNNNDSHFTFLNFRLRNLYMSNLIFQISDLLIFDILRVHPAHA